MEPTTRFDFSDSPNAEAGRSWTAEVVAVLGGCRPSTWIHAHIRDSKTASAPLKNKAGTEAPVALTFFGLGVTRCPSLGLEVLDTAWGRMQAMGTPHPLHAAESCSTLPLFAGVWQECWGHDEGGWGMARDQTLCRSTGLNPLRKRHTCGAVLMSVQLHNYTALNVLHKWILLRSLTPVVLRQYRLLCSTGSSWFKWQGWKTWQASWGDWTGLFCWEETVIPWPQVLSHVKQRKVFMMTHLDIKTCCLQMCKFWERLPFSIQILKCWSIYTITPENLVSDA